MAEKRSIVKSSRRVLPGTIPGFTRILWRNKRGDVGKILVDKSEPGVQTHIHRHSQGLTISRYRKGHPPERFTWKK